MRTKPIIIWLTIVAIMVFMMVFIGGVTRLTDSGLSMVDWRPLMGTIPPITDQEWLNVFEQYKQYPEYQKINSGMSIGEFKKIFFWEYFHRLFGRLIGLVYFFPLLYFWVRNKIPNGFKKDLSLSFVLGGMQGLMGWYMVKSGLVDRPDVSHFRLAAHLSLAFLIIGQIYWTILKLKSINSFKTITPGVPGIKRNYNFLLIFLAVLGLQIVYGAFVAGLDAGLMFNTFPKMGSHWVSPLVYESLSISNFVENMAAIQFIHRFLGIFLFGFGLVIVWLSIKSNLPEVKIKSNFLLAVLFAQFLLGISTLMMGVPISLASLHQVGACLLLLITLSIIFSYKKYLR